MDPSDVNAKRMRWRSLIAIRVTMDIFLLTQMMNNSIPVTDTDISDPFAFDEEEYDEEAYWNRIYESLVDEWCSETNKQPSEHPYIRYYCGYVEPLCKKLDLPEYKLLAGFFMQKELLDLSEEDIDYTELHGIDWLDRSVVPLYYPSKRLLCDSEATPLTLRSLKEYDLDLWSYAVIRNLLCYDIICDADRDYVDSCVNNYPQSMLLRFYVHHGNHCIYMRARGKFNEALKTNYLCVPDEGLGKLLIQHRRYIKP